MKLVVQNADTIQLFLKYLCTVYSDWTYVENKYVLVVVWWENAKLLSKL